MSLFGNKVEAAQPQAPVAVESQPKKIGKTEQVAKAALVQDLSPKRSLKDRVISTATLPRIAYVASFVAAIALVATAASFSAPAAIAGFALAGAALVGASLYESTSKRKLDRDAKELFASVKALDARSESNKFVTAQDKYRRASETIRKDIVKMAPQDRDAFIAQIAKNGNKDYRINTNDNRYGFVLPSAGGVSFEGFVQALVGSEIAKIENKYNEDVNAQAKVIADKLQNNIDSAQEVRNDIFEAAYKLNNNKDYKALAKNQEAVMEDVLSAVRKEVGATTIQPELSRLDSFMKSKVQFWNEVSKYRADIRKDFDVQYKALDGQIKGIDNDLKDLQKEIKGLDKERVRLYRVLSGEDEATNERLDFARNRIPEINAKQEELEAKKEALLQEKANLQTEQKAQEAKLGEELTQRVNAKRTELARLLGQESEELTMPLKIMVNTMVQQ